MQPLAMTEVVPCYSWIVRFVKGMIKFVIFAVLILLDCSDFAESIYSQ